MAVEQRERIKRYYDFSGGLNTRLASFLMRDNELLLSENIVFDKVGLIKIRKGRTLFKDTGSTEKITSLHRYYKKDGTKIFLFAKQTTWDRISDDGVTVTTLLSGLSSSDITTIKTIYNYAIFLNGKNEPRKYDGTTVSLIGGTPPIGLYYAFRIGRIFLAGDPLQPSRLYYSESGQLEVWETEFFGISSDDGSVITGLVVQGDDLIILKETSVHILRGEEGNWILRPVIVGLGCISPKSLAFASGIAFFLGRQGGQLEVYALAKGIPQRISQAIEEELKLVDQTKIKEVTGFIFFPKYYLTYTDTSGNKITLVYDMSLNNWTKFTNQPFWSYCQWTGGLDAGQKFAGDGTTGKIYKFDEGTTDEGTGITGKIRTKYDDFGFPEFEKRFTEILLSPADIPNRNSFTFNASFDEKDTYTNLVKFDERGRFSVPDTALAKSISLEVKWTDTTKLFHGFTLMTTLIPYTSAR